MKNLTKIFLAVMGGLFAFSCATDATEDLGVNVGAEVKATVTASLEQARTQLGEKAEGVYPLYWSEGDAIAVNGVASNPLTAGGSANADFSFNSELIYPLNAVYPAPAAGVVAEAEGAQVVTFAVVQPYTAGTFAPGVAPMYGYTDVEGEAVQFNHLSGVLCFNLKGNGEVLTSATISSENGVLAGNFDIDCTTGALTAHADASNIVSVTFGDGLTLGAEATPIYVAVPAGDYGYVSITLHTADSQKMTIKFNSSNKPIAVGVVREFSPVEFEANNLDSDWFEIYDVADMLSFAKNAANFPWVGAKLMATIDMSEVEWTPAEGFSKIFDGNRDAGHKIIGLNAPLFGTTSATIKNLNLNVNIEVSENTYYDSTTAVMSLAGLARISEGPISDCTVSGNVAWARKTGSSITYIFVGGVVGWAKKGTSFNNVKNEANISSVKANNTTFLGGIAAVNGSNGGDGEASIINCENTGNITVEAKNYSETTSRNSYIGGITGSTFIPLTISGCKNSGNVTHYDAYTKNCHIGGIYGVQYAIKQVSIHNCENTGDIYANTTCGENCYIGGVLGSLSTPKYDGVNLSNLKNSGNVTVEGQTVDRSIYIGGVAGYLSDNTDDTTIDVENWYNSGTVTANASGNVEASTYTLYLGGVFGNATRVNVINFDNTGSVIYGKDSAFTKPSTNTDLFIGGIGGYRVTGNAKNCDNSGTIYLKGGNSQHHHQIGGIFGQINTYSAVMENCTNSGDFEAESTFKPKRCRLGGLVGCLYYSTMKNCVNTGNVNYNASETSNQMYIGGAVGYAYSSSTGNHIIENVANSGKLTVNKGVSSASAQICVAGIVGSAQKIYTDASCIKDCTNIGDIEINLPTTFTGVDVGGIVAHHSNITNTNIAFSGHKSYATIKALGWTIADVGTVKGINNTTVLLPANCSAGGKIVLASEEILDGEDANGDKNYITIETPGALTADNWFNYVFAGGSSLFTDNTYNGCSLLATKPTVTLVTTPQPTPAQ